MARTVPLLCLTAALLAGTVLPAMADGTEPWPPRSSGSGTAAVAITTAWASRLRAVADLAGLEAAAGGPGRLEAVEQGEAPRAVYGWTGAGGRGHLTVLLYRSGGFAAIVDPADARGEIVLNSFGAFVCPACAPPVKACGRRPSWVPHSLHWDVFDCGCTLTGPQSLAGGAC